MSKRVRISVICSKGTNSNDTKSISQLNKINSSYWKHHIERVLDSAPDIIVLPENCDRFSDYNSKKHLEYVSNGGTIADTISEIARDNKVMITYPSIRLHESDKKYPYRNCIHMYDTDGNIAHTYDKNHVMIEENDSGIGYGTKATIYETQSIKMAFAICFDLNFDSLLMRYKSQDPDLLIFSSYYHGGLKQDQWAYALRSYMASAITGNTGRIINPFGQVIASTTNYYDYVTTAVNLDYKIVHLDYNMEKIQQAKKKYKQSLTVHDPGNVATVMLTCEADNMQIDDIIKEFQIETYDEYLQRSIEFRAQHLTI